MEDGGTTDVEASDEGMTAEAGLDTARGAADSWAEDAVLVEIATIELGPEAEAPPGGGTEQGFDPASDETIGDGLAPGWAYTFMDGDGERTNVIVNTEGETTRNEQVQTSAQNEITEWEITSEEAAEAARDNATFEAILGADDAQVIHGLGQQGEEPGWFLSAQSESMDEEQTILVNAMTGESQPF